MLNSFFYDTVMVRLTRSSSALRAKVVGECEQHIRDLERGPWKPHFLEKTMTSPAIVAGTNTIALPDDFIEEYEDGAFRIQLLDGTWADPQPKKVSIEVLEEATDGVDATLPTGYALYGDNLVLGPAPLEAYPYKLKYYGHTTPIPDDGDTLTNKWGVQFFNYTTLSLARLIALTHLQSQEMASKLQPELAKAFDVFWRAVESRKIANMDPLLGDTEN